MISIQEATKQGIKRLRDPRWVNPEAYIRIGIIENGGRRFHGPWGSLYDRKTQEVIGEPTPQKFLLMQLLDDNGEEYKGPLDKDDKD